MHAMVADSDMGAPCSSSGNNACDHTCNYCVYSGSLHGAYWFVGGLFTLAGLVWDRTNLGWMVFTGVISMLGGLAIMVYPFFSSILVVGMLVFLIGFWAILIGAAKLYDSYLTKNAGTGILGILSVLFGLILLIYPIAGALSLALIAGFFALIGGISSVAFALTMRKAVSPT